MPQLKKSGLFIACLKFDQKNSILSFRCAAGAKSSWRRGGEGRGQSTNNEKWVYSQQQQHTSSVPRHMAKCPAHICGCQARRNPSFSFTCTCKAFSTYGGHLIGVPGPAAGDSEPPAADAFTAEKAHCENLVFTNTHTHALCRE